ncbi:hypothetical protein GQ473_00545 [archaeon]|nr:hypothetical protein [archaeon]
MLKFLKNLKEDKYIKIAAILLFAAFFLGYTMRVLDFTKSPALSSIGVIYPIHQESYPHYMNSMIGYESSSSMRGGYDQISESPIDFLYVARNNIVSSVLIVFTGVLFAIPSIIFTFLTGLTAGQSIPEVLEFANGIIAAKTIFLFISYAFAIILATSIGIELGIALFKFIKEKKLQLKKTIYDKALLLIIITILNIILQYLLLVI